jgi:uncharacterized protein involved in exopolysaccharide biosynthesis
MHEPSSTPPAIAMTDLGLVWRYKKSIILATLVAAGLAFVASFFIKPVYEAEVNVQIGKASASDLEDTFQVVGRVNSRAFKSQYAEEFQDLRERLIEADPVDPSLKGQPAYVKILTQGRSREAAMDLARRVAERVIAEHQPLYDAARAQHEEYAQTVSAQIDASKKEVARMEETLRGLEKNPAVSAPSVLLLQAQLEDRQTQIVEIAAKLRDARIQQANHTRPTRMLAPAYALNRPIWPKRAVIVLVAAGLALLVAVLMVVLGAQANRRL